VAATTNYVKVGLFVILGAVAAMIIAVGIGVRRLHRETVSYYTFFNESVDGLDVSSPVKLRGVRIGQVGDITLAPDRTMIEVRCDMDVATLRRLSLTGEIPPDLRTQLGSAGLVTGQKYVAIDHFDPGTNPPPVLPFPTPENYIPAAQSVQKSLEDSLTRVLDGVQQLVDGLVKGHFSDKVVTTIGDIDSLFTDIDEMVRGIDRQKLPVRAAETLDDLRQAIGKAKGVLARVDGDTGLVATTQKSVTSIGDIGRNAASATRDLDETFAKIRDAADSIRILADEIERDPEVLLKGRARSTRARVTP
jgi:phospholipid/cholesterol/gamma-HCH transport system substrate-binding protein